MSRYGACLLLILGFVAVVAQRAQGAYAYISELYADADTSVVPNTIEITFSAPPPGMFASAAPGGFTLLVVTANPNQPNRRRVLSAVTISAAGPAYPLLICSASWPPGLWSNPSQWDGNEIQANLHLTASPGATPDIAQRTVLLLDRPLSFQIGQWLDPQTFDQADILDAVSFGPGAAASRWGHEPVLNLDNGYALARPRITTQTDPRAIAFMQGDPDAIGRLTDVSPSYQLNPGRLNPRWTAAAPEPATLALVAAAGLLLCLCRPIRPSERR